MAKVKVSTKSCPHCGGTGKVEEVSPESLREVRQESGDSLRSFAAAVGVSAPYLSDVERGNRRATPWIVDKYRKKETP